MQSEWEFPRVMPTSHDVEGKKGAVKVKAEMDSHALHGTRVEFSLHVCSLSASYTEFWCSALLDDVQANDFKPPPMVGYWGQSGPKQGPSRNR